MKTKTLFACLQTLVYLATAAPAHAAIPKLPLSVTLESRLDSVGESAQVMLANHTALPMICDSLDVSLSVIRAENDLPVGTIDLRFANIFVGPGQSLTESNLGANELAQLRASDRSARLFRIVPTLGACRAAEWGDYCNYAPLNPEERKTVALLKEAFGARDCSDLRAEQILKIRLPYAGIRDPQPFSYFPNLRVLRLGGNPIESIAPLLRLDNLTQACLGHTPVASKGPLPAPFSRDCD
jgi:Leucine-rich repeat (LRR) protein